MSDISNITHINLPVHYYMDLTAAYILTAAYMAVGGWCVAANCLLLVILITQNALHTQANVYVGNIAASDLSVGLGIILMRPLNLVTHASLDFAKYSCLSLCFVALFTQMASIHALFCATFERYVKICHPFRYQRIIKTSVTMPLLCLSWVISFLYGCTFITVNWYPESLCQFISTLEHTIIIACTPYVVLLLAVLSFFNIKIFSTVQRHRRQIQGLEQQVDEQNVGRTKLIGMLVLFSFVAYAPFLVTLMVGLFVDENNVVYRVLELIATLLMYSNNVANPVIFGWKDKKIRKYGIKLLHRA